MDPTTTMDWMNRSQNVVNEDIGICRDADIRECLKNEGKTRNLDSSVPLLLSPTPTGTPTATKKNCDDTIECLEQFDTDQRANMSIPDRRDDLDFADIDPMADLKFLLLSDDGTFRHNHTGQCNGGRRLLAMPCSQESTFTTLESVEQKSFQAANFIDSTMDTPLPDVSIDEPSQDINKSLELLPPNLPVSKIDLEAVESFQNENEEEDDDTFYLDEDETDMPTAAAAAAHFVFPESTYQPNTTPYAQLVYDQTEKTLITIIEIGVSSISLSSEQAKSANEEDKAKQLLKPQRIRIVEILSEDDFKEDQDVLSARHFVSAEPQKPSPNFLLQENSFEMKNDSRTDTTLSSYHSDVDFEPIAMPFAKFPEITTASKPSLETKSNSSEDDRPSNTELFSSMFPREIHHDIDDDWQGDRDLDHIFLLRDSPDPWVVVSTSPSVRHVTCYYESTQIESNTGCAKALKKMILFQSCSSSRTSDPIPSVQNYNTANVSSQKNRCRHAKSIDPPLKVGYLTLQED